MKTYLYVAVGVAALATLGWFIQDQRSIGGSAEREKQVKENAQFVVNARKGAVDYDTCDLAGGVYAFETSTCKLP